MKRKARKLKYGGWSSDAKRAITENPDYFVWWYTVKSVGLALVFAALTYHWGKEAGRKQLP